MMLIYYKTWIYQCLIKQVKSPSICSRIPETSSDPPIGSGRESGCDRTNELLSVGTISPRVLLFLGIVTRKCIFVKICVWLSNSNRIACV